MSDAVDSAAGGRLSVASRKQDGKAYRSRPSASWATDVEWPVLARYRPDLRISTSNTWLAFRGRRPI